MRLLAKTQRHSAGHILGKCVGVELVKSNWTKPHDSDDGRLEMIQGGKMEEDLESPEGFLEDKESGTQQEQ